MQERHRMGTTAARLRRSIFRALAIGVLSTAPFAGTALAETILVAADAGARGASVAGNKVYRTVAAEVIAQLEKARFKVIEPEGIPQQYLPRRRRPSAEDWVHVFNRNVPKMDGLVTITVVNRVIRSTAANVSSIDLMAEIYHHGSKKPIAVIDIPSTKDAPMKQGCFGPCMMRILSENVAGAAKKLGTQVVRGLKGQKIEKQYRGK
jgi:hypothetical protein